jgi:hypothetical protein
MEETQPCSGVSLAPYPEVMGVSMNPGLRLVTVRLGCKRAWMTVYAVSAALERPYLRARWITS